MSDSQIQVQYNFKNAKMASMLRKYTKSNVPISFYGGVYAFCDNRWKGTSEIIVVFNSEDTSYLNMQELEQAINKAKQEVEHDSYRAYYEQFFCFVTRDEWGAKPSKMEDITVIGSTKEDLSNYYNTIVIHHSNGPVNEQIKKIQEHHQKENYGDVGYHFVVGFDGAVYEGMPIEFKGSHVGENNSNKIGIVLLGNFEPNAGWWQGIKDWIQDASPTKPSNEQLNSLVLLIQAVKNLYGIDYLGGHRDFTVGDNFTQCPGQTLYDWLEDQGLIKLP